MEFFITPTVYWQGHPGRHRKVRPSARGMLFGRETDRTPGTNCRKSQCPLQCPFLARCDTPRNVGALGQGNPYQFPGSLGHLPETCRSRSPLDMPQVVVKSSTALVVQSVCASLQRKKHNVWCPNGLFVPALIVRRIPRLHFQWPEQHTRGSFFRIAHQKLCFLTQRVPICLGIFPFCFGNCSWIFCLELAGAISLGSAVV